MLFYGNTTPVREVMCIELPEHGAIDSVLCPLGEGTSGIPGIRL